MRSIWKYIEAHHREYGVALFIVPALVVLLIFFTCLRAAAALIAT
jgi:membrane-bound metal-dependent hydrolase YbcI (DUF457 family)